jgi:hypothetical protein
MSPKYLISTIFALFSLSLFAQDDCQSIMTIKRNFIERNLVLSNAERQKFWDLYNPYLKEESEIFEASRALLQKNDIDRNKGRIDYTKLTEKQLYVLMEDRLHTKEQLIQLERKLYEQLKKVLSAKTLYQFYQIEGRFKAEIKEEAKGACTHEKK